nr:GDSL esterase/lipase At1g28590-like [Ipomoea batatas]GME21529.1 GDSL esterase/lipase At1g28590-like [Ipomoea batatas]
MASSSSSRNVFVLIYVVLSLFASCGYVVGQFRAMISFGDSLADTGNLVRISQSNKRVVSGELPYGETYFHHPTGRFSDGRLVVDFIAQSMGFPLLPPSAARRSANANAAGDFTKGVNFAVAGATAVDISYLEARGVSNPSTNVSLGTQLEWFKQMLPSVCNTPSSCKEYLQESLILMGEIGGNDYNHPFLQGHSKEEVLTYVPDVVNSISLAINELIELGAQTLIVPGNLPIGCSAAYLTVFASDNKNDYDATTGCLNWLNEFSQYHNQLLQEELDRLRQLYPDVTLIYADYYNAAMRIYRAPSKFGFASATSACCGGEGPYHYHSSVDCGGPGSTTCDDPSTYVSWDGVHLTEAAYKLIATGLLQGPFTIPHMSELSSFTGFTMGKSDH